MFDTGSQAVFADSVATPTALFQTVAVGAEFAGFQLSFDVLNGLSPTVPEGAFPDSFFATVYLGTSAFGPSLDSAVFDEAVALFDMDAGGFFGVAAGATFSASPKGSAWTRYTLTFDTTGVFEGGGFLTVAFQFFNLNTLGSDSTVAVDNVDARVISAPLRWRLAGGGVWDSGTTANWRLLNSGIDRVFDDGAPAVFDGEGGTITVAAGGVTPGGVRVLTGGYVFAGGSINGLTSLLKTGSGLLVIESDNGFIGGVVVEGDGFGASGLACFCAGGVLETVFCGQSGAAAAAGSALWVMNSSGSATGAGPVQVGPGGALGGMGTVAGAVTVHGDAGGVARLVPGSVNTPETLESLKLQDGLYLGAEAEVVFRIGENGFSLLEVTGEVVLNAGARVRVLLEGSYVPAEGAVFPLLLVSDGGITLDAAARLDLPAGIDWDTDDFAALGVLRVRGVAGALTVITPPQDQTVRPGDTAIFNVTGAGPGPIMVRWFKDGVLIPGQTGFALSLFDVDAGDEGDYHAELFNGTSEVASSVASLQVRDFPRITTQTIGGIFQAGDDVAFSVTATGPGPLSYVWSKDGAPLPGDLDGPGLSLDDVALPEAGFYSVTVSNAFGSVTSGLMELRFAAFGTVANAAPQITHSGDLPPGQVGLPYFFPIPLLADSMDGQIQRQPTKVTVTGLPSGLAYDSLLGGINGIPRATRSGGFRVTITASNGRGKVPVRALLQIAPLPAGFIGTYTALVERNAVLNEGCGGTLVVKVAASGALSGTHDEGGKRRKFRGALALTGLPAVEAGVPAMPIARGRNVTPHSVSFTLDARSGRLIGGVLSDGVETVAVAGWRKPWSRALPATKLAGYYTSSMNWQAKADQNDDDLPRGFGYLTLNATAKTGDVRVSGRLPDGASVTGSTFCGPNGQVLVYRTLYPASARGSLHGMVVLTPKLLNNDNTLEGCVTWNRPANLARGNRLYRDGFTTRPLEVAGGRYTPPDKNQRILGLTESNHTAELVFAGAGIENALPLQAQTIFTLNEKNRATFDTNTNPRRVTFSVVGKTGLFKGFVNLRANNPLLLPDQEVAVPRKVSYFGVLIGQEAEGAGYVLVPRLPAILSETPRNTAIDNAAVLLGPFLPP